MTRTPEKFEKEIVHLLNIHADYVKANEGGLVTSAVAFHGYINEIKKALVEDYTKLYEEKYNA